MTRLEKIILEQTRKSKPGTIGQTVSTDAVNQKAKQLKAMSFLLYYVFGKKESPIDKRKVASVLPKISIYGDNSIYSRGEYFYVIGEDYKENEGTNKAVIYYPIYIIRQSESDIESLNKFMIGGTTIAPIIDINDFQNIQDTIKKKKADAEAAAIAAAEKKKPAIEITKVVVQNVVKGTETINVNNLGKGTPDADAFQELMWQAGNKLNFTDEPAKTDFKNFAYYRTKGLDGGWDGDIGDATLDALYQFVSVNDENLYDMWAAGKKAEVIEELRLTAAATVSESINYFKGKGMNVKLKDLLQEQLLKEQAKKAPGGTRRGGSSGAGGGGGGNAGGGVRTPKPKNTGFTQATLPAGYTGTGKITYDSGDKFTGSWVNGFKSGPGIYKFKTGKIYDGTWSNGMKNGEFKITYPNGDIRVGTFSNSVLSGPVTFTPKGGKPVEELWKDGVKIKTDQQQWEILKAWIDAEEKWWKAGSKSTGPAGQKVPKTRKQMFAGMNFTFDPDDVVGKAAYEANRKHALEWLESNLDSDNGSNWYSNVSSWIDRIADQIDDYFQNVETVNITNDETGDSIYAKVEAEMFD
jgi:hypothetical protein